MRRGETLELLTTGMYIAFWAEMGVLTRIYLDKMFSDACTGYWGFCLLSQGTVEAAWHVREAPVFSGCCAWPACAPTR